MLDYLHLLNFQNHRDTRIDLGPVTVLVGDNDAGKTAALRGLEWLAFNRWDGAALDFVTWGEAAAEAVLGLDGREVTRRQGKAENLYTLDGGEYRAFHPGVPQDVARLLNLRPANFQGQLDPAFWLSLNGPAAAQALNELFNLKKIDDAAAFLGAELRRARAKTEAAKGRLIDAEDTLKTLSWVADAGEPLVELEAAWDDLEERRRQCDRLERAGRQMVQAEARLAALKVAADAAAEALRLGEQLVTLGAELDKLEDVQNLEVTLCRRRKELEQKERLLAKALAGTCPLCLRPPPKS